MGGNGEATGRQRGGLISKIECDIIVASDVPGDGYAFDQIDKVI